MPRYENEGWNPKRRTDNDSLDRTVPLDENYYSTDPYIDLNFNSREGSRRSAENSGGFNPCDYEDVYSGGDRLLAEEEIPNSFTSETPDDFQRSPSRRQSPSSRNTGSSRRDRQSSLGGEGRRGGRSGNGGKGPKKRKISVASGILIFVLVLILAIVGSIFPVLGKINYDEHKDNEYVNSSELTSSSSVKNILLLGVDARSDESSETSRSDTMMLVSVDSKHHSIKLTSFLRDTWVYIPCEDTEQRLNAACTYGGYKGVVDTIEYNFEVKIDNYVVTDFEMFQVLVDSIGGVEVEVTEAEAKEVTGHPKRYGNVELESGKQTLNGKQALAYCRIRKIDTDFVRTERQRTVMSAILSKMKSSNPITLYKMAYNAAPYIETDMSKGELISLAMKALPCMGNIYQAQVPFEGTWSYATISGNSVISIDKDANKNKLIDYIYNKSSADLEAEEKAKD